jgi:hypothetical protein
MSHEYAMSRVRDALEKSGGNRLKTQRLILSWLENDHTLLFGLVAPHLQGILSHAIAHVERPPKKEAPKKINLKNAETGEFGEALLSGLRGQSGNFGEATPKGVSKPGKASKAHVDAINALVSASKDKGTKGKK